MTRRHFTALAATLVWTAALVSADGSGRPATGAAGDEALPRIEARIEAGIEAGKRAVCPVCGMFVAMHPEWLAQVVYEDGSEAFFDGPKDLFVYLLAPERYAADKRGVEVTAVLVTSYYEGAAIPARQAFYVLGSDVSGPMGAELVPHRTLEDAEEFARDHRGETIVQFDDVTRGLLQDLE